MLFNRLCRVSPVTARSITFRSRVRTLSTMSLTTSITLPHGDKLEIPNGIFINGEFVKGVEGKTFETINPATEKVICSVHEATAADVDIAVLAARKALEVDGWNKVTGANRGKLMSKLADLMDRDVEILASLESIDNGKALGVARTVDVPMSADCIRYYSGWADKIHGQVIDPDPDHLCYTRIEPMGVCGQIIPWNFPLLMWAWKIGPAIAAGNVVIIKSAEQTPLSALYMAKLIKEAGFPPGVINVLSGFGKTAGAAIAAHMDIDKVAFTGSTPVGRAIMIAAAKSNIKKVTLELGGKSPNIVFKDADIDRAVSWVNFGMFFNHGQTCSAGSRIYVQEDIYDEFIAKLKERVKQNIVGEPHLPETFQGPQVSQLQFDRVMGYIEHGKQEGAKVEIGGKRFGNVGYFIEPTIFSNVHEDMKILQEEIFGPVCSIASFKTEEDVIRMANNTAYGLAAGIHSTNVNTIAKVSAGLKAGTVWVNTYNNLHHQLPFGGFKQSGIGKELGEAALAGYTKAKTITTRIDSPIF